jgi:hypothetical protein
MHQPKEVSMRVNRIIGRLLVAVGLVTSLIVPAAFAQKPKPSPTPTPIPLSVVLDGYYIDGDGNKICIDGYNICGDGSAYEDAIWNVRAEIYYAQFYLDTNENKGDGGRRVNISFTGAGICPTNTTTNIPCPAGGLKDVYIATQAGADPAQLKQVGESTQKRLAINWAEGAYSYHLRHNGTDDPRHGSVTFTCTAADTNGCYQWSATPTHGYSGTVGLYANPTKGNVGEVYLGSLNMPFVMTLTKR